MTLRCVLTPWRCHGLRRLVHWTLHRAAPRTLEDVARDPRYAGWSWIVNLSQLAPVSDYWFQVWINDTPIAAGRVRGHTRADGWRALLRRIADSPEVASLEGNTNALPR